MDVSNRRTWGDIKHQPADRSEVVNPIRSLLETDLKIPADMPRSLVNLGLGKYFELLDD